MSESWQGRTFEIEVGPVAHGGHCVSRVDGRVVFMRHALPGERVLAEVTEDAGKSFCRADAVKVLSASPQRVTPPCPVAGPGLCGGCDWQHAAADAQLDLKAAVVSEQLRRLAGIERPVRVEALPGGLLRWRTRVRFVAAQDGRAGLRAHRSHRIVPLTDCPITTTAAVRAVLPRRWGPGNEIEVTSDSDGQVHVREAGEQRVGGVAVQRAAGRRWRLSAHGFWQVHPEAAETFASVVDQWAEASRDGLAWDLYAGAGLFAGVLAQQVGVGGRVLAVEADRRAVADGEANTAGAPQVRWRRGAVERVLRESRGRSNRRHERPEVVVLDPPRKGAGKAVVEAVSGARPERVVYVACDPAALARDLATFAARGYRLDRLRAFDAFPMTHHVECIALLRRG
ncbi:tRNA/tmRNA/rRNA uracil-C5-methylase (TrmA/RlmC/RlmD family) [Saccharomonospora amisosensis]|uniref:tRNA/tmRNA/rRNA uracil-C5-methylase (TrmA/RlmC/RlmD family) n=1 Tax=Saccharomonospora amisosensis TaxID=1128677 RepID=A0A7X5UR39_9PSEU|nr:class I SAM-dependent RNA methyltransferase [Saccharomonospora amisosensis]NIJ12678.1 tRNA/tmRNA/rRNA uracil-C5-methylase (TrmA/RlmC/RlmD family) [Saccharomonospora amisosensis]